MNVTPDFLFKILSKHEVESDIIKVDSVDIQSCTHGKLNFLSQVHRVKAHVKLKSGELKVINIIAKRGESGMKHSGFETSQELFVSEEKAYKLLGKLCDWLKEKECKIEKMWADCYYSSVDQSPFIIMLRDLADFGYEMNINGSCSLDEDHALVVIRCLAKMHALTGLYIAQESSAKNIAESIDFPKLNVVEDYYKNGLISLSEALKQLDSEWNAVADYLVDVSHNVIGELVREYQSVKEDFPVLSMGDCWTNNILFKYSDSKPISAMFIDFQMAYYNSFAWDLSYVLYLTILPKYRLENREKLLKLYVQVFSQTIADMGGNPSLSPSYDQIIKIMDKLLITTFLFSSIASVELLSAVDDDYDTADTADGFNFKKEWFINNFYDKGYKENMEYFKSKGLFSRK